MPKTLLEGHDSSWILFVYVVDEFEGELIESDEGDLSWMDLERVYDINLIGFIRKIMPLALDDDFVFEGKIVHDLKGEVLEEYIVSR